VILGVVFELAGIALVGAVTYSPAFAATRRVH